MKVDKATLIFDFIWFPYMFHVSLFMQRCIDVDTVSTLICHFALGFFRVGSKHFHVKSFAVRSKRCTVLLLHSFNMYIS